MTRTVSYAPGGPTIRIGERFEEGDVERLAQLLEHLPTTARVVVDLSLARKVADAALLRLYGEIRRHRELGRTIALLGVTLGQWRILEQARRPSALP